MATNFGRMPKMATTEPSVDEVKMKKGGSAGSKKKMAMGGNPMMSAPTVRPRVRTMARPGVEAAAMPPALLRKKGGDVSQDKALIKKAFKQHDKQEHKEDKGTKLSLKRGGKTHHYANGGGVKDAGPDVVGGLLGGIEATKPVSKKGTGAIMGPGYKKGGMASGGTLHPAIDVNDKVHEAKQTKSFSTKTGGVGGKGYKNGGTVSDSVAKKYKDTMVHDGEKMPTVKGSTGEIKQKPAGYKDGGHVTHHTTMGHGDHGHTHMHKHASKHAYGHAKIEGHRMKGGGSSKISTHKKKGGSCNY
jgi:hypothetical protein